MEDRRQRPFVFRILGFALTVAACLVFASCSFMGYSAKDIEFTEKPVAELANYSGILLVKSNGKWGQMPRRGMALYSGDKVVTLDGSAMVEFYDGGKMGLCRNSNLLITQKLQRYVPFRTFRYTDRAAILFMGRLFFDIDSDTVQTHFATPSLIFTLFSGVGNVAVDPKMVSYMLLESGQTTFKVGEFKWGAGRLLSDVKANESPIVQAALEAEASATQAQIAADEYAAGRMSAAQKAWYVANADEKSYEEEFLCMDSLERYMPERDLLAWARKERDAAREAMNKAAREKKRAVAAGASVPGAEVQEVDFTVEETDIPGMPSLEGDMPGSISLPPVKEAPLDEPGN